MNALQNMRGGDVVHVEGRVLAQQDHVHFGEIGPHGLAEREMVALDVTHLHFLDAGENLAVAQRQPVRRVVIQLVTTPLRFQGEREGSVAGDVDGRYVVHLDSDFEGHAGSPIWSNSSKDAQRFCVWNCTMTKR